MSSEIFSDLFVLDIANNHEGSVELGNQIIDAMGEVTQQYGINAGFKFQYRDLDTFIHPEYRDRDDVQHIPRFLANELSWDEFSQLATRVKERGMRLIITPFDEPSVERALEHGVDILKVASCSAADWPLLEAIAETGKPVLLSTAGLTLRQIDAAVSFFTHKEVDLALMHCVALYPTPAEKVHMNFMVRMQHRYPDVLVGYSGHEEPDNLNVVRAAVGAGAHILERHVGIPTPEKELNRYSMNPEQVAAWIEAAQLGQAIAGSSEKEFSDEETASLLSLQRGVFARRVIKAGEDVTREAVFFAMPASAGQLTSGQFGRYRSRYVASRDYAVNEAVMEEPQHDSISELRSIIHDAKGALHEAGVKLGSTDQIELSHHHGIEFFREVGATIVNVINREYCKKLIVMLPSQQHPNHYHRLKEETFHLLRGDLTVTLDGKEFTLEPGDQLLVERNAWHSFATKNGAVFEEVSTTHVKGDSYYEDDRIAGLDPTERKTIIESW